MHSKKYDAILIPGGGIQKDGSLPEWTQRRLKKAIELFSGTEYLIPLSAGTVHKPPVLDREGFLTVESEAACHFLLKKGMASQLILAETASLDTIGNAYFSRVIHAEPARMKKLVVVTSAFHMPRTKAIFDWVYSLTPLPTQYQLEYVEVTDKGIDEELIKIRTKKEMRSLKHLQKTKKNIQTLSQFHTWLYTKHSAYSVALKPRKLSGKVLDTY